MLIAIDFDGTIAEDTHDDRTIGSEIPGAIDAIKAMICAGHHVVLFTLRDQPVGNANAITSALSIRLNWLMDRGITRILIPRQVMNGGWKLPYDLIIDDKAHYPPKAPDWAEIRKSLGITE